MSPSERVKVVSGDHTPTSPKRIWQLGSLALVLQDYTPPLFWIHWESNTKYWKGQNDLAADSLLIGLTNCVGHISTS